MKTVIEQDNECDNCLDASDILYYDKKSGMNLCQSCQIELRGQKKVKKLREEIE